MVGAGWRSMGETRFGMPGGLCEESAGAFLYGIGAFTGFRSKRGLEKFTHVGVFGYEKQDAGRAKQGFVKVSPFACLSTDYQWLNHWFLASFSSRASIWYPTISPVFGLMIPTH